MQRVWDVIQRTLITAASICVMGLVASQYVTKPDLTQLVEQGTTEKEPSPKLSQAVTEPNDENIVVVDVPVPEGRYCGVTQCVDVRGGRVVGLQVKFERLRPQD